MQLHLPASRYSGRESRMAFYRDLLDRLSQSPGIAEVGLATAMPNGPTGARFGFTVDDDPPPADPFEATVAEVRMVTEGFFQAMGIRVSGRGFTRMDDHAGEPVAVISRSLARRHLGGEDAVGHIINFSSHGPHRIVGVADDLRPAQLGAEQPVSVWLPLRQTNDLLDWHAGMHLFVRSTADLSGVAQSIREVVLGMDPEMPVFEVRPLTEDVSAQVAGPRFSAAALVLFSAIALGLASVGVFGVMSYSVSRRTHEIGVRVALGASGREVLRMVVGSSLAVVLGGLSVGLVLALAGSRVLASLLHGVAPNDPITLSGVAALLLGVAAVATWVPARRALAIEPVEALREE